MCRNYGLYWRVTSLRTLKPLSRASRSPAILAPTNTLADCSKSVLVKDQMPTVRPCRAMFLINISGSPLPEREEKAYRRFSAIFTPCRYSILLSCPRLGYNRYRCAAFRDNKTPIPYPLASYRYRCSHCAYNEYTAVYRSHVILYAEYLTPYNEFTVAYI